MNDSTAVQTEPIARALLVCDDPEAIEIFTASMRQLAVAAEVCLDATKAKTFLAKKKIEAIVVDARVDPAAREVVQTVRVSTSNRKIVVLAIADSEDTRRTAQDLGASFIFEPPFSASSIEPTLRAAYGMIVRERRRYFRAVLECPVFVKGVSGREVCCSSLNVSEGGISVMTETPLSIGDELNIRFTMPGLTAELHSSVIVRWCDSAGRAGLQFVSLLRQPEDLSVLHEWLGSRLEASFPAFVASKFDRSWPFFPS